jgi:hypothetical protein
MYLLYEIERHLRKTETKPACFGREAANDPRFVWDLRNGREPRLHIERKVREFIIRRERDAARRRDPHEALRHDIEERSGGRIVESASTPWASATFAGWQHHYVLLFSDRDRISPFLDSLAEKEFDLPGHILADISAGEQLEGSETARIIVEALTVEDA